MSSQDDNDKFEDTTASPSTSVPMVSLPVDGQTDTRSLKKRKRDEINPQTISENNITRFRVLKKLNIQLTRTEHHIKQSRKNNTARPRLSKILTPIDKSGHNVTPVNCVKPLVIHRRDIDDDVLIWSSSKRRRSPILAT